MKKRYIIILSLYLLFISSFSQVVNKKSNPIVQSIAGIKIGPNASNDNEVIRIYGNGFFLKDEGHCGARYFTNFQKSITLRIVLGVDRVVEEIILLKGLLIPFNIDTNKIITNKLPNVPSIDKNLYLGMTSNALIKRLGKPNDDKIRNQTLRVLYYSIDYENDPRVGLIYDARYTFRNDSLIQISIYDGD
jgi:hypothetical protein